MSSLQNNTSTIRLTTAQTPIEVIKMTLTVKSSPQVIEKVFRNLISKISASGIFDSKMNGNLHYLEQTFAKSMHAKINDNGRKTAAKHLCFLISDIIEPAFTANKNNFNTLNKLYDFKEAAEEVLKDILPESENSEIFLKTYKEASLKATVFIERIERIKIAFDTAIDQMNKQTGEILKETLEKNFTEFKLACLSYNNNKAKSIEESQKSLATIKEKVAKIAADHLTIAAKVKEAGDKMIAQLDASKITLINAQALKS